MLPRSFSLQVISRWHVLRLVILPLVVAKFSSVSTNKNVVVEAKVIVFGQQTVTQDMY